MGARLVSPGSLISGSRGGSSPTTLLATIVSLDPIYLSFDLSEADYAAYQKAHQDGAPPSDVAISLYGDGHFDRHGKLDFIDNAGGSQQRYHPRARHRAQPPISPSRRVSSRGCGWTSAARSQPCWCRRRPSSPTSPRQIVMTVAPDGTVVPKLVEIGDLEHGLRVIRDGLAPGDRIVIDGFVAGSAGAKVTSQLRVR